MSAKLKVLEDLIRKEIKKALEEYKMKRKKLKEADITDPAVLAAKKAAAAADIKAKQLELDNAKKKLATTK